LSWSGRANTYCKGKSCTEVFRFQSCAYWNPAECTCSADIGKCPDGYTMDADGTACYILRTGQTDFLDAQNICLANGDLGLARIRSDSQWIAAYGVQTAAHGSAAGTSRHAYIGGNDIYAEGNWVWMDGTPMDYFRWRIKQGEQSQPEVADGDAADCIKLVSRSGYFADEPCSFNSGSDEYDFICERKPTCGPTGSISFGLGKK